MQIRRLLAVLLAAVMALTLTACGNSSNTNNTTHNAKSQETTAADTGNADSAYGKPEE